MEVEIQDRGDTMLLYEKIEDLLSRTKPWSRQTQKLISQLKDDGIEILDSQLERQTVVVWIWCQSQAALTNFQEMYETNQMRDVFFGALDIQPYNSVIIQSKVISIDNNQFKKTLGMFLRKHSSYIKLTHIH